MNVDILITICCVLVVDVYGYNQYCSQNQTIFAAEDSKATFRFIFNRIFLPGLAFERTDHSRMLTRIFTVYAKNENLTDNDIYWFDVSWEQRTHIESKYKGNRNHDVTIVLSNITMKDNGTYTADSDMRACFILFVMEIQVEPRGSIEENKPLYVYAHPHKSVLKRPFANATMVWLLDGSYVNDTASFIQDDGYIWIPHTHRDLDGTNVTYRAIQENGNVNDVNYTLNISYGPIQPLTLHPGKTQYYLVSGDSIPEITCSTECKPPCSLSWDNHSSGPTLSLGTVQSSNTGGYTCTAHWNGMKAAQKTISIYIADNSSFTIAIASLASVQALLILGLGLYAYCSYRQVGQAPCKTCLNARTKQTTDQNPATELNSSIANNQPDHYEELNTDTRLRNYTYSEINPSITELPGDDGLEVYENNENTSYVN